MDIAERILRQLLSYFDNIPPGLESLYNQCIQKEVRPDIAALIQLLKSCSLKFTTIYAVFDAFDECSDAHQDEILAFLSQLQQLNYRLLISSRLHLRQQLQDRLSDTQIIQVSADELDLKLYITTRLDQKGNRNIEVKERCLELTEQVQGV